MPTIYGYFNAPDQLEPAYDPGLEVPCPICGKTVGNHTPDNPIKTISVMLEVEQETGDKHDDCSYFYRVHKTCYDALSAEQQSQLDWPIVDARAKVNEKN